MIFDDNAATAWSEANGSPFNVNGAFSPETGTLGAVFTGEDSATTWTVDFTDSIGGDDGIVYYFAIEIISACGASCPDCTDGIPENGERC